MNVLQQAEQTFVWKATHDCRMCFDGGTSNFQLQPNSTMLSNNAYLTLSSPVVSNGYTSKHWRPYWSIAPFLIIWHLGTLALRT